MVHLTFTCSPRARKCKKAKRLVMERTSLNIARRINEMWSMDFVGDSLANGQCIKSLAVVDDPRTPT